MKVSIERDGTLTIVAESVEEDFTLQAWWDLYQGEAVTFGVRLSNEEELRNESSEE